MDQIEQLICQRVDENKDKIIAFGRDLWHHAELGFQEFRTAGKFAQGLKELGLETEEGLAITGVKGYLKGKGAPGITVALMGEFDGLPIPNCKYANPETGAAHCCGHHAQATGVYGAAFALTDPEIAKHLDGNIVFFGVPAEEYVEVELRNKMREEGKLRYGCGKCELIRIGAMDDIDITVGHHSATVSRLVTANRSCNGVMSKLVRYTGRASHAAGGPEAGVDAQNAALLAMRAVDMQRETFRDKDYVRVHGWISKVEGAANIISDDVSMEFSIRGKTVESFMDAAAKVDRSLKAGALATGCGLSIKNLPGSLPIRPVKDTRAIDEALRDVGEGIYPITCTGPDFHATSSGDYGDVSAIMPLLQFNSGGFSGRFHSPDVDVADEYEAYVLPAKIFALVGYKLLKNGGDYAKALMDSFEALFTKEEYIAFMERCLIEETIEPNPLPLLK